MKKSQWPNDTITKREQRGLFISPEYYVDARNLVDKFIDQTNKFYKQKQETVHLWEVCVAAEVFIRAVLMKLPKDWEYRRMLTDHIIELDYFKDTWDPPPPSSDEPKGKSQKVSDSKRYSTRVRSR